MQLLANSSLHACSNIGYTKNKSALRAHTCLFTLFFLRSLVLRRSEPLLPHLNDLRASRCEVKALVVELIAELGHRLDLALKALAVLDPVGSIFVRAVLVAFHNCLFLQDRKTRASKVEMRYTPAFKTKTWVWSIIC